MKMEKPRYYVHSSLSDMLHHHISIFSIPWLHDTHIHFHTVKILHLNEEKWYLLDDDKICKSLKIIPKIKKELDKFFSSFPSAILVASPFPTMGCRGGGMLLEWWMAAWMGSGIGSQVFWRARTANWTRRPHSQQPSEHSWAHISHS